MKRFGLVLLAGWVAATAAAADEIGDVSAARGAEIFAEHCAGCHSGEQPEPWYPAMQRLARLRSVGEMISAVVEGRFHRGGEYNAQTIPVMPAWGSLSDYEVAAVVNYIQQTWGESPDPVTAEQVTAVRHIGPDID